MSSSKKPPGSIHRIREFELEKIHLIDEFDLLQIVGEGWFGKILLVEHRASDTEMVLKAVPKPYVSLRDFYREFHYGLHLGIHRNIVTTYDVAFETAGFYVFTQEYAPLGDLTSNVTDSGIGELHSKRVAKQIASALDYIHSKDIVHRDVKLDNVLIYRSDFSRVKLCDFGESYQTGTIVERRNEWLPYSPPEVLQIKSEGTYKAESNHDVWQFAIVVFVCLTGCLPWQKAASDDPRYMRYLLWQGTMVLPIRRTPKLFKLLTSKASRMFRRFLEPRADRRPKSLADLTKFIDDRWLAKSAEKDMAEYEPDELCPSMYSFHSSPEEKNRLLCTLAEHGIETTVDRQTKKNRIRDWIESSVINEEDEEEENESASPSSSISREPVPGHISSLRATESASKQITTTLKDSSKKHFDPRTGALQEGPSAMGANYYNSMDQLSNQNNGSLMTLGSRTDLISSNAEHTYMSDMNINTLGERQPAEPMINARLNIPLNNSNANNQNAYNVNNPKYYNETVDLNYASNGANKKAINGKTNNLQRTKSNSVKQEPMLANQKQFVSSSALNNASTFGNGLMQAGLANAFQSLATISMPNEQLMNNTLINSQVKDSGYGSYDKLKSPIQNASATNVVSPSQQNMQQPQSHRSPSKSSSNPNSNINAMYRNSGYPNNNSSLKDTPYDRILAANRRIK